MRRLIKGFLVVLCGIIFTAAGGLTGYYLAFNSETDSEYGAGLVMAEAQPDTAIGENTVLEFVYNYSDGFTETQQSLPQQFMYGWDREKTQQAYSEWLMTEFSGDRVVFNRNVEGNSSQHYILKENNGYIAVYYRESDILKETTSTPVAALSEEDRKLFEKGVEIDGEKNLIKYIEGLET
ncbi:MAG: hypothetical protein Q4D26_12470 [Clostridia bacterium]|nr:hypothetical protein [Clostridia bacterium]